MNLTYKTIKTLFKNHTLTINDNERVVGISKDTHTIKPGEIYVAIKGDAHDGHDYVDLAFEKGAIAAIVHDDYPKRDNLIYVKDSVLALGKLAHEYRKQFSQPIVAITGSSGKTTTKELLTHVLSLDSKTIATKGNLNNHIGVPFTVFSFEPDAKYFVVEMGMSHLGEIEYLTKMVNPTMGLITNIGKAHLEGVGGNIEGVAKAKGELFKNLTKTAKAFSFNDSKLIAKLNTSAKKVNFGFDNKNDFWVKNLETKNNKTHFKICIKNETHHISINLMGKHHVQNALAVFSIAYNLGLPAELIIKGLESFDLDDNRGKHITINNTVLINDTYNANPDSMKAALNNMKETYPQHNLIAVLGDMLELGINSQDLHKQIGEFTKKIGIKTLFAYGQNALFYLKGYGYNEKEQKQNFFIDHTELSNKITASLRQNKKNKTTILFKGSRGMTMEKSWELVKSFLES